MENYTEDQVAEHWSEDDCWVIIDDKVYDLTSFIQEHPGGSTIIHYFIKQFILKKFQ